MKLAIPMKISPLFMVRSCARSAVIAAAIVFSTTPSFAQTAAKELFGHTALPALSAPEVHGFYSKGCVAGAVAMPIDGPNWQTMRLERNRRWGHPDLIGLLQKFSRDAAADGWPGLLVGDISQPRGGPMLTGHASHQIGLDADIWLTKMPNRRLTKQERASISATSMLKNKTLNVDPKIWTAEHGKLLRRAASYSQVQRIFIHPGIKKVMCDTYDADPANASWLGKLRPYYGHHYHFHIRINCPAGSKDCRPQEPIPAGSGCDKQLAWWFTSEPWAPAKPKKPDPNAKPVKKRVVQLSDLPKSCAAVLQAPQPANADLVTLNSAFDPAAAFASATPSSAPIAALAKDTHFTWPIPGSRPN